jgi:hypothetical protein
VLCTLRHMRSSTVDSNVCAPWFVSCPQIRKLFNLGKDNDVCTLML